MSYTPDWNCQGTGENLIPGKLSGKLTEIGEGFVWIHPGEATLTEWFDHTGLQDLQPPSLQTSCGP